MVPDFSKWPNFLKMLYSQVTDNSHSCRAPKPERAVRLTWGGFNEGVAGTQLNTSVYYLTPTPSKPSSQATLLPTLEGALGAQRG